MFTTELSKMEEKLKDQEKIIKKLTQESFGLKKAIWDILNYANIYVIILDSKMIIRLINWCLSTELGYVDEKEAIGKCWLEHIPEKSKGLISNIHHSIAHRQDKGKCHEMINEIETIGKKLISVKWFNIPINSGYDMTFSMGIKVVEDDIKIISEDSIRAYYRDIIEKDRTMIKSLRDVVINSDFDGSTVCLIEDID